MQNCSPADVEARKSPVRTAHLDPSLPASLAESLWSCPELLIAQGDTLQKSQLRSTVRLDGDDRQYVLKRYQPDWWQASKGIIQASRAWSTWTVAHFLADAGVATPRPVACVEDRWRGFRGSSYVMYPYVPGKTLRERLATDAKHSPELKTQLWRQLEELWLQLTNLKVSLADAKTGNFIVDANLRLWAIDLDKSRVHGSAQAAGRGLQRGWEQLVRSAAKC